MSGKRVTLGRKAFIWRGRRVELVGQREKTPHFEPYTWLAVIIDGEDSGLTVAKHKFDDVWEVYGACDFHDDVTAKRAVCLALEEEFSNGKA